MGTRQSKVTVLLDRGEFERLDQFCETRGFKKSTLISKLIREHLDREAFPSQGTLPLEDQSFLRRSTASKDAR